MKFSLINTRSIVIIGYCLLVTLAITGIATIYYELIKSHRQSTDNSDLKKELIDLSNTLTTMYQAEGTAGLLAFADNAELKFEYDSLTVRVFDQIDSLQMITTNEGIRLSLDSLSVLLLKKHENALEMFQLMKQIDKNIVDEIMKRTIITRSDIDRLNAILAEAIHEKSDTVQILGEKKGFFQRLRDVVKSNADTLTQISKGTASEKKELLSPVLSDTIVDFFRQIDKHTQAKNAKIIQQLLTRQHELYIIKELTGMQITNIMDTIKELEYQSNLDILKEKNESLKRSSQLVAIVGLSALIVAVFFMSWTLHSLNKAQLLQKNIQEAKKHAEKLLILREQLIYTITHDIKAPLSSIIGFLDLISEDTLSQKQQYYLDNMNSSASHILDLVHNLLDFHAIEKERPQPATIAFLPASLIRNIYESFLPLAQKKRLTFELNSSLAEAKVFLSDPYYIRQIVNNLLSNAVKFTPEDGRILLITSLEEHNCWKISVQDTGPGIDPADQAKVFEEFVRLGKPGDEVEGSGLGLTISGKIAALLGGTIEIESQKGVGSTFTLAVPLIPVPEEDLHKKLDISSGRILFIDDDKVQLNLLSELMKKEEWPCICCSSAYEALNILREKSVDIIFTDIRIPDMDGFEMVKRIRKLNLLQTATVPIIAFSADSQKSETELKAAGFTESLLKPFKVQQLLEIIEKYTSLKRITAATYREETEGFGWQKVMDFVSDDPEAAMRIIDSFIEETNKDKELLNTAFQKKDDETVKQIAHKMLSLMKMIPAQKIVSILTECEKGDISKRKKETLFRLLEGILKEAEAMRKTVSEKTIVNS
ncbi:MAG: ATP-binding protein [Candidatus Azobacteroides sp.]|nr:ATP-binding protein [Candidatus Azobacteroides sp.]